MGSRLWSSTLTRRTSSTCGGRRCCRTQRTRGRKKGSKRYGEGGTGLSVAFKESTNVYCSFTIIRVECVVCTIKDAFLNSFIHSLSNHFILASVVQDAVSTRVSHASLLIPRGNLESPNYLLACFREVGGKWRTWRKPTQSEHVKIYRNLSSESNRVCASFEPATLNFINCITYC